MKKPTESEDRAAILDLIHRNRITVWTGDFEGYQRCFVHAPYTTRWNASRHAGIFVRQGWDEIADRVRTSMADPKNYSASFAHDTTVEDLELRIMGDMAWATFRQGYPTLAEHHSSPAPTFEMRVFERHAGEWRIAFLGFLEADISRHNEPRLRLDRDGSILWRSDTAAPLLEAEDDLLIRNGKLRARDQHTDAKLQEAIRWAASLDDGVVPRHGERPIVKEVGEGIPVKLWWVIAEGAAIYFSFADPGLEERLLAKATEAFNLSPAQSQLAVHIVAGRSLAEAAAAMGITANTARTHLGRMFDKTGVRTQPALVRMLLSTTSPI